MSTERWLRLEQIFADALQLPPSARGESVSRTRGSVALAAFTSASFAFAPWICLSVKIAAARASAVRLVSAIA